MQRCCGDGTAVCTREVYADSGVVPYVRISNPTNVRRLTSATACLRAFMINLEWSCLSSLHKRQYYYQLIQACQPDQPGSLHTTPSLPRDDCGLPAPSNFSKKGTFRSICKKLFRKQKAAFCRIGLGASGRRARGRARAAVVGRRARALPARFNETMSDDDYDYY